jgi:hydroxymethylpyrimidine kinase / phosphomethylpyrimidine kinase / thiamine-phosphate diphosphorylase
MKTVLIIAGSDPGAGAGLQQDLKVATLLGAYGLTVPTALTVQNSLGVQAVLPVAPEIVAAQLDAVISDFPVAAVKIGMLADAAVVTAVAACLKKMAPLPPVVLDPVLAAGGGFPLLEEAGIAALKEELFPMTCLLTPNVPEAARLAALSINSPADLEEAARRLQAQGPRWVLAKGGHLEREPVDVLTDGKNAYHLPGLRLAAPNHHGSGCLLASACAAGLAQGLSLPEAVNQARRLTHQALKFGLPLGHGAGPVNPYAPFARDLARFEVLEALKAAAARLQAEDLSPLIPEVMTNLGFAAPYPEGPEDVAAFPGRLVKSPSGLLIPALPAFGASKHIAAVILSVMAAHPDYRSAMNLRFIESIAELAPLLHLRAVSVDRGGESAEGKRQAGGAPDWEVASALQPGQAPPDLLYDQGAWGREAMTLILGSTPMAVAEKALALKHALQAGGKL